MGNRLVDTHIKTQLIVVASLLEQGRRLDGFSHVLLIIVAIAIFSSTHIDMLSVGLMITMLVIVLASKYYAIRVSFDCRLFHHAASQNLTIDGDQLDSVLHTLNLIKKPMVERDWHMRSQGALMLLKKQVVCCVLQVLIVSISIINVSHVLKGLFYD